MIETEGRNNTEITAILHTSSNSAFKRKDEDGFTLEFRVLPTNKGQKRVGPRMFWSLVHLGSSSPFDQAAGVVTVTRLDVESSQYTGIVAVTKTIDLVNTAVITGRPVIQRMWIYALMHDNRLKDVTSQASCHSVNSRVLRLADASCHVLRLIGSEDMGWSGDEPLVIAKLQSRNARLKLRVWYPELPLRMSITDPVLSVIRGWKVPRKGRVYRSAATAPVPQFQIFNDLYDNQGRSVKGKWGGPEVLEPWISVVPDPGGGRAGRKTGKRSPTCRRRYQQARVAIHARFFSANPPLTDKHYLGGGPDALLDVTNLVGDQLTLRSVTEEEASDPVAELLGDGWLVGRSPGVVEVSLPASELLLGRGWRHLARANVTVTGERVRPQGLRVQLVHDLTISVVEISPNSRYQASVLASTTSYLDRLTQPALLAVDLLLSDGAVYPLSSVLRLEKEALELSVKSLRPDLVRVVSAGAEGRYHPASGSLTSVWPLIQVVPGPEGTFSDDLLEVRVDTVSMCRRSRDLVPPIRVRGTVHRSTRVEREGPPQSTVALATTASVTTPIGSVALKDDPDGRSAGLVSPMEPMQTDQPGAMTPLAVGMYVLLGVFCVAALVFAVNCGVMVSRSRRHHRTCPRQEGKEVMATKDSNWVWMGPETLKRHAVNTRCTELLLPAEQFPTAMAGHTVSLRTTPSPRQRQKIAPARHRHYQGKECSIRIVTNPLPEEDPLVHHSTHPPRKTRERRTGGGEASPAPPFPPPPVPAGLNTRGGSGPLKPSTPLVEEHPPQPPLRTTSRTVQGLSRRPLSHPGPAVYAPTTETSTDIEWDYEMLGLSYDQLMEYFSNLKESVA